MSFVAAYIYLNKRKKILIEGLLGLELDGLFIFLVPHSDTASDSDETNCYNICIKNRGQQKEIKIIFHFPL